MAARFLGASQPSFSDVNKIDEPLLGDTKNSSSETQDSPTAAPVAPASVELDLCTAEAAIRYHEDEDLEMRAEEAAEASRLALKLLEAKIQLRKIENERAIAIDRLFQARRALEEDDYSWRKFTDHEALLKTRLEEKRILANATLSALEREEGAFFKCRDENQAQRKKVQQSAAEQGKIIEWKKSVPTTLSSVDNRVGPAAPPVASLVSHLPPIDCAGPAAPPWVSPVLHLAPLDVMAPLSFEEENKSRHELLMKLKRISEEGEVKHSALDWKELNIREGENKEFETIYSDLVMAQREYRAILKQLNNKSDATPSVAAKYRLATSKISKETLMSRYESLGYDTVIKRKKREVDNKKAVDAIKDEISEDRRKAFEQFREERLRHQIARAEAEEMIARQEVEAKEMIARQEAEAARALEKAKINALIREGLLGKQRNTALGASLTLPSIPEARRG